MSLHGCFGLSSKAPNTLESQTETSDSLTIDSAIVEIPELKYSEYRNHKVDYNKRVEKLGFKIDHNCQEICDTYLIDKKTKQKTHLPSGFDAGLLGIVFPRSGKKFITYSSYDTPDYADYYEYRSEFTLYKIIGNGQNSMIKETVVAFSKNWSIAELIYINNHTIGLKLYDENYGDGTNVKYRYFKMDLD
jgi:hypothetical protein